MISKRKRGAAKIRAHAAENRKKLEIEAIAERMVADIGANLMGGECPDIDCIVCDDGLDLMSGEQSSCNNCGRHLLADGLTIRQDTYMASETYKEARGLNA